MMNDEWLQSLLSSGKSGKTGVKPAALPAYEKNATTQNVLTSLRESSEQATLCARSYLDLLNVLKPEYAAQASVLREILSRIGIDINCLPKELLDSVTRLREMTQEDYDKVVCRTCSVPDVHLPEDSHVTETVQLLQNLKNLSQSMQEASTIEQKETQKKAKEVEFLTKKGQEMASTARHFDKRFEALTERKVSHSVVVDRVRQVNELQAKLRDIRSSLNSYGDITPDINIARVQVQKAREDLARLEEQISAKLSSMQL